MAVVMLSLIASSAPVFYKRSMEYIRRPDTSFEWISLNYSRFERYRRILGSGDASMLIPDIGGPLYYARHFKVYDLGMLCDRTIAKTLFSDKKAFHEYVFGLVKPTFIHVAPDDRAGWWALDDDVRFGRDYTPIAEERQSKTGMRTGDFVRKGAVRDSRAIGMMFDVWKEMFLAKPLR